MKASQVYPGSLGLEVCASIKDVLVVPSFDRITSLNVLVYLMSLIHPPRIPTKTLGFLAQVGRLQRALLDRNKLDRNKEAIQPEEGGMLFEDDISSDDDSGLEDLFPGLDI